MSVIFCITFLDTYKDVFKELRREKMSSPSDAKYLCFFKEILQDEKKQKIEALRNLLDIDISISETAEKVRKF